MDQECDDAKTHNEKHKMEIRELSESKTKLQNELDSTMAKNNLLEEYCVALEAQMETIQTLNLCTSQSKTAV